jgi:hypothetical protein
MTNVKRFDITRHMDKAGIDHFGLAERMKDMGLPIHPRTAKRWYRGEAEPGANMLPVIAAALGKKRVDSLYDDSDEPSLPLAAGAR